MTLTVQRGLPTPILVAGVERRGRIDTTELYGNAFARARVEAVRRATTRLEPPSITNIIVIAAPTGVGRYTTAQIEYILTTAASGIWAAVIDSSARLGHPIPVVEHSGFWGCGGFGGNRVVMLMLQIAAAGTAGLAQLVLHTRRGRLITCRAVCPASTLTAVAHRPPRCLKDQHQSALLVPPLIRSTLRRLDRWMSRQDSQPGTSLRQS